MAFTHDAAAIEDLRRNSSTAIGTSIAQQTSMNRSLFAGLLFSSVVAPLGACSGTSETKAPFASSSDTKIVSVSDPLAKAFHASLLYSTNGVTLRLRRLDTGTCVALKNAAATLNGSLMNTVGLGGLVSSPDYSYASSSSHYSSDKTGSGCSSYDEDNNDRQPQYTCEDPSFEWSGPPPASIDIRVRDESGEMVIVADGYVRSKTATVETPMPLRIGDVVNVRLDPMPAERASFAAGLYARWKTAGTRTLTGFSFLVPSTSTIRCTPLPNDASTPDAGDDPDATDSGDSDAGASDASRASACDPAEAALELVVVEGWEPTVSRCTGFAACELLNGNENIYTAGLAPSGQWRDLFHLVVTVEYPTD